MRKVNWRIYRLPGSREVWHIDSGTGTTIFNVKKYRCAADSQSVDIGGNNVPRAWIEILGADLHIVNGTALFSYALDVPVKAEVKVCAASPA
jgi:hypothetical protein